jgi:hypothetical protein
MKAKPLKHYGVPSYPTRLQVLAKPDLLENNQPPGWRKSVGFAGVISLFLAANSYFESGANAVQKTGHSAKVAPIFQHGGGRTALGCVIVAPPTVFLSEEEAIQVISEELAPLGLKAAERNIELEGAWTHSSKKTRYTKIFKDYKEEGEKIVNGETTALKADIYDKQRKIAVEFVSNEDYFPLGGVDDSSSLQEYDFKKVAQNVADCVKNGSNDVYFGAFYDPAVMVDVKTNKAASVEEMENFYLDLNKDKAAQEATRIQAKRLLRMQVKDFMDWLKAQGAI